MKVITIFKIVLMLCFIYSWIVFYYIGNSEFVDITTIFLLSVIFAVLFMFTRIKDTVVQPLFVILIYGTLFWFILRLMLMIAIPESIGRFPATVAVRVDAINNGLVYLILSTIMVAGGFIASRQLISGYKVPKYQLQLPAFITLGRVIILYVILGLIFTSGHLLLGSGRHWIMSFMTRLVNPEALLYIGFLVLLFGNKHATRIEYKFVFVALFMWYLFSVFFAGSRQGFILVVLFYLIGVLLYRNNGYIKKKLIFLFGLMIVLAPIMFSLATVGSSELRYGGIANINDKISMIKNNKFAMLDGLDRMSMRLAGLDTLAVIVNADEDNYNPREYINFSNEVKSIANTYVLGEPFPDALITSKAFHVVYQGGVEDTARNKTFTQKWSGYGLMFVKFGWYGGLMAAFILAFLFSVIYRKIVISKGKYSDLLTAYLLYIFFVQIMSNGVDEFFLTEIHSLLFIGGVFNVLLLKFMYSVEVLLYRERENRFHGT